MFHDIPSGKIKKFIKKYKTIFLNYTIIFLFIYINVPFSNKN